MSFLRNLFGGGSDETPPAYTDFEAGDIFYTYEKNRYQFFKVLKAEHENGTLHILMYQDMSGMPTTSQVNDFKVRVYHLPIDKNGFNNPQLFCKTQVNDADLPGYHEYLKQTRNIDEIVARAKKYFREGFDLTDQGNLPGAIDKYSMAVQLIPHYYEAIDNMAFCKMDLGMLEEAMADFKQSLAINPGGFVAIVSIGECYFKLKDFQQAKPYFEQALAIRPGHEITEEYLIMTIHFLNEQTGLQ